METLSFIQELIARWKAESPKFFKIITTVTFVIALITGIPAFLSEIGVADLIPESINVVIVKIVAIASFVASIIAKLTVNTPEATEKVLQEIVNRE